METTVMEKLEILEKKVDGLSAILEQILAQNLGTKSPREPKSGDKKSPLLLTWSKTWEGGEMSVRPANSYRGFERRYVLRPEGPTKFLGRVIDHLMSFPQNQNFHVKSKRTYVHVGKECWERITPKLFFEQFRRKLLKHYRQLVLRAQPNFIVAHAKTSLKNAIIPWTNQHLEKVLGKFGESSWARREKKRKN